MPSGCYKKRQILSWTDDILCVYHIMRQGGPVFWKLKRLSSAKLLIHQTPTFKELYFGDIKKAFVSSAGAFALQFGDNFVDARITTVVEYIMSTGYLFTRPPPTYVGFIPVWEAVDEEQNIVPCAGDIKQDAFTADRNGDLSFKFPCPPCIEWMNIFCYSSKPPTTSTTAGSKAACFLLQQFTVPQRGF